MSGCNLDRRIPALVALYELVGAQLSGRRSWRRQQGMTHSFFAALVGAIAILGGAPSSAQNAYITNSGSNTVSVIDTATNTVVSTIPVGISPGGVAVTPDGSKVYVTNFLSNTVSVIATATNTVVSTIPVGPPPARGGHPGQQQGLCRELQLQHRIGDRHCD